MAFDVTNFWIGDYSGTNKAYYYSPTGTVLKTITLSKAAGFYDGLEFFNGNLIANEFDGGFGGTNTYDVYDTDGNLLTAGFIKTTQSPASTGIAFDGTNFWVAGESDGKLYEYNGTTGAFIASVTVTPTGHAFEDLSVDYNIVIPPSNGVPEPGTLITLAGGLLALGLARRRCGNS
jgi:DNA-binding beta-propeller fold protein YncE